MNIWFVWNENNGNLALDFKYAWLSCREEGNENEHVNGTEMPKSMKFIAISCEHFHTRLWDTYTLFREYSYVRRQSKQISQ